MLDHVTTAVQSPFSYAYEFNLAEEVVRREHGEDAWDAILLGAGLDGSWTSLGSYPDEHLERVVTGAAKHYGQTVVISQPTCMLDGASRCLVRCRFSDDAA